MPVFLDTTDAIVNIDYDGGLSGREEDFDDNNCAEIIFTSDQQAFRKEYDITQELIANNESIITYLKLGQTQNVCCTAIHYCYDFIAPHPSSRGGSIVLNNPFIFIGGV